MQEWHLDLVTTSALTVMLVMLGFQLKHRIKFLERFCIPVAVIGGFAAAMINLIFKETGFFVIHYDTTLQVPAMVAFFTTIGLAGSYTLIKQGGKLLITYLVICWILVIFQDVVGATLAGLFGLNPIFGVMAGGVSLQGGHGTAAAFGSMAESLGVTDATTVALACATFGLIAGGLLGGPVAARLIKKHQLVIPGEQGTTAPAPLYDREENLQLTTYQLIASGGLILVLMTLGFWSSHWFENAFKIALPSYVGAMFVAIVFRNINDHFRLIKLNNSAIDVIADLSLGFFLTQATMNLKVWDLYSLALPLSIIVIIQIILLTLITLYIVFPLMGKNYDSAVMCSGLMGHGLGAVPSAVANMDAVCQDFRSFSYKAFLIVPLCGAVLIDIIGIPFHVWIINYLN